MRGLAGAGIGGLAALLLTGGCAPGPLHKDANRVDLECPASHTLVCEVSNTGRMRHGTFARRDGKCACVRDGAPTLETPAIPRVPSQ